MPLFQSSVPERRDTDRTLPVIPIEIYIHIFEGIAPPTGRLTQDQLVVFANLSRVCRFFANFCFPRTYEFLEFSGSLFCDDTLHYDTIYGASREGILCTQIVAKQPLALALAEAVKVCRFKIWRPDDGGAWAVRRFTSKSISGILHMRNIREFDFSLSFVDTEHWDAIATLPSLERLSFESCNFLHGPADVEPETRVKVKVSHLKVVDCFGHRQLAAAIDVLHLHTLSADAVYFDFVDGLSQSVLTELHIHFSEQHWTGNMLDGTHAILERPPPFLETLEITIVLIGIGEELLHDMFGDAAWRNLLFLPSFTLGITTIAAPTSVNILFIVLKAIRVLPNLHSFIFDDERISSEETSTAVRHMLHEGGLTPSLKYVDFGGNVLHLADGG